MPKLPGPPPGPPPVQSAVTVKPPVAVRVTSILGHFITPSVGSIGLPSMHLVPASAVAPSWLDARDHCPAVGAGSCASVIGPAGPAATVVVAASVAAGAAARGRRRRRIPRARRIVRRLRTPRQRWRPEPRRPTPHSPSSPASHPLPGWLCFTCVTRVCDPANAWPHPGSRAESRKKRVAAGCSGLSRGPSLPVAGEGIQLRNRGDTQRQTR